MQVEHDYDKDGFVVCIARGAAQLSWRLPDWQPASICASTTSARPPIQRGTPQIPRKTGGCAAKLTLAEQAKPRLKQIGDDL